MSVWLGIASRSGRIIVFTAIFAFYLSTLSENFSINHDSIAHLLSITGDDFVFHPNHLIYQPFFLLLLELTKYLGVNAASPTLVEVAGAFFGALTLLAGYAILRDRVGVSPLPAIATVCAAGSTFGIWYYSISVEIYILPLACLAWAFYVLSKVKLNTTEVLVAALLHSAAILFHQVSILFCLVPLIAILNARGNEWRYRFQSLLVYILIGVIIVGGSYVAVAQSLGRLESFGTFLNWMAGLGNKADYWSPASFRALLDVAIGLGRAFVGGHFIFAIPQLQPILERFLSSNTLVDELFFTRNLGTVDVYGLAVLSMALGAWLIVLMMLAVKTVRNGQSAIEGRLLIILLLWLFPYVLFFTAWDAANVDFWIPQVFIIMLLLGSCIEKKTQDSIRPALYLTILAAGFLLLNGIGSVLPARDSNNDYFAVFSKRVAKHLSSGDLLIIGDSWPASNHLAYHTDINFVSVSKLFSRQPVEKFLTDLDERLKMGERVYLADDVFNADSASTQYYGQAYSDYLDHLRTRVCGMAKVSTADGPLLWELTCIRRAT